ncbi:probable terpene synthase 6 [Hevea brasiliensis]|uniref:probable terpene synthase 6 n=1 Tax=Hevea brasiliensis TaxID=3981 RepID=UPI0025D611AA|nr:probable terpene synthase 6 [Hevea brasiliensis]
MAAQVEHLASNMEQEISRPLAYFPPTVWGCDFASLPLFNSEIESYTKKVEVLKEKVKDMLMSSKKDLIKNIEFINLLCRLGISYHFENEIEEQLNHIFNVVHDDINDDYDLYNVALLFRILRQHGYKIPCNVFKRFKDSDGKFNKAISNDVKGILSLYEASFVSMRGEDILDEAIAFARPLLESLAMQSSPHLAKHINDALSMPFHRGLPRVEARKFIYFYEEEESHNETLLKFAKLDYNRVQLLHKQELGVVSRWWKELDLAKGLPYVRDRIAEGFFESAGVQFEPNFALSRILLTKCIQILALVDDTYDSYGTLQELQCFTDALERGNSDQLPADYLKILYKAVLDFFEELGDDEGNEGRSYCINYTKERYKEVVRSYLVEAQWFYDLHLPPFNEYMHNALISSSFSLLLPVVFLGVENLAGVKEFKWLETNPKLVEASKFFGRLLNDMVARKDEEKEGHCLAGNCYMKEYGVSKEKAMEELRKMCDNAWKDMNEESMRPTAVPMPLITSIVNLARMMEVVFQYDDGYTIASSLKDHVTLMFVEPIPED